MIWVHPFASRTSKAKVKDLSKSNAVAGEGMIRWSVYDVDGKLVHLELPGYHISAAEVRLLSPHVLLELTGDGKYVQTKRGLALKLGNGVQISASYCPRSGLPILPLTKTSVNRRSYLTDAFAFSAADTSLSGATAELLSKSNVNVSPAQKETLLWHQRLLHASISWIQLLMRDRKWLRDYHSPSALHQGPFIPCKEPHGPSCNTGVLKCSACITAKARIHSPASTHSGEI